MRGLAGIGAAAFIVIAGIFWFMSGPTLVVAKREPLQPSANMAEFEFKQAR